MLQQNICGVAIISAISLVCRKNKSPESDDDLEHHKPGAFSTSVTETLFNDMI